MNAAAAERFESKVEKIPEAGCWVWMGSLNNKGYGVFSLNRKQKYAHRVSYQLYNGPIPDGLYVLHRCDNPACVSPTHLFLGTQKDNMRDMMAKGRRKWERGGNGRSGEGVHFHELTELQVLEIRRLRSVDGMFQQEIAEKFGVSQPLVSRILNRKVWKHI